MWAFPMDPYKLYNEAVFTATAKVLPFDICNMSVKLYLPNEEKERERERVFPTKFKQITLLNNHPNTDK